MFLSDLRLRRIRLHTERFLPLLRLADDDPAHIDDWLARGTLYGLFVRRREPVSLAVLTDENADPQALLDKAAESNNLVQDKYITISVARKSVEEARAYFHRLDADLAKSLGQLDTGARILDNHERLRILHDFFRPGDEQYFRFDLGEAMRLGHDFRDYICPDGMQFKADHFEMGGKFGRVLFLRDYPSYIKDEMISKLSDFPKNLMLSIDILPIPTGEAVRDIQSRNSSHRRTYDIQEAEEDRCEDDANRMAVGKDRYSDSE